MSEPRGREGLQGQVKPKQVPLQGNDFLVRSPGGPDLTPIFIIKNVVFKQVREVGGRLGINSISVTVNWEIKPNSNFKCS